MDDSVIKEDKVKEMRYERLIKALRSVVSLDEHWVTGLANTCALIQKEFSWHWVGFYLVNRQEERLFLGPFQGPLACSYVPFTKGVCGRAYREKKLKSFTMSIW